MTEMTPNIATLDGLRALVTGGASGIGAACARTLAEAGASVTVADINAEACRAVAAEIGGTAWVADLAEVTALADVTVDTDILVNNVGIQYVAPIERFPPEMFETILRLMVKAPFLLIRAALPGMYRRGFGRIINISSVHGLRASPYKAAYVTAKHGLEGLSKATAMEAAGHGVTSNCINPGYVRTPLVEHQIADQARVHGIAESDVIENVLLAETAIKRLVEPDEVAQLALWLAGPQASMVTGSSYLIDGGWTAS